MAIPTTPRASEGTPSRRGARRAGRSASVRTSVAGIMLVGTVLGLLLGGRAVLGRGIETGALSGPLPACGVADLPAPHATLDEWRVTLLDTTYGLGRSYEPDDLTSVAEAGIAGEGSVRAVAVLDLEALGRAARHAGEKLVVSSAYRSFDAQARTFDSLARAYGDAYALRSAARAGHSEHQLGTTIDFEGGEAWLADNAWRFGFVMSYPPARSPRFTCYKAEPWHFRYLGRERTAAIQAAGISPREWLWEHANDGA